MNAWDNRSDAGRPAAPGPHRHRNAGQARRWRLTAIAAATVAAVLVIGGAAAAVTLKHGHGSNSAGLSGALSVLGAAPAVTAVADVTPPVSVGSCVKPATFRYSGTLATSVPETVTYQWVYSTGKPGPVQTLRFTHPGHTVVTGQTVASRKAGTGWAELQVLSPRGRTSNKAAYQLLCGRKSADGLSVAAAVTPATQTAVCTSAPPDFTADGTIRAAKAETVTYYWALSDGKDSAPATLAFPDPGTKTVTPLTIAPAAASGTGEAVLVVSGPVTAAARPAKYTLNCKAAPVPAGSSTPATPAWAVPATPATSSSGRPSSSPSSPSSGPTTPSESPSSPSSSPTTPASSPSTPSGSPTTPSGSPSSPVSSPSSSAPATVSALQVTDNTWYTTAYVGVAFGNVVFASGGNGTYNWGPVSGLPAGLTATPTANQLSISGTPGDQGTVTISGSVSDGESPAQTRYWSVTIIIS